MRLNRNTAVLIILSLIIIVAALVLTNNPANAPENGTATPTNELAGPIFPDIASTENQEKVVSVTIQNNQSGETLTMTKNEEAIWSLSGTTVDPEREVDQTKIVGSMGVAASLEAVGGFPLEGDLATFGLDEPTYVITLNDGERDYSLKIGRTNADNTRYYGLVNDDTNTIYQFRKDFRLDNLLALAGQPPYIAQTTDTKPIVPGNIFPGLAANSLTRLEIAGDGGEIILERTEDNFWTIGGAVAALANPLAEQEVDFDAVNSALSTFVGLRALTSSTATDLAPLGLAEPAFTLTATDFNDKTYTVAIGSVEATGSGYYALVGGDETTVYLLDGTNGVDSLTALIANPPYRAPEATAEATAEITPEATAEATAEITPEATAGD